jgi:hypothetical protein
MNLLQIYTTDVTCTHYFFKCLYDITIYTIELFFLYDNIYISLLFIKKLVINFILYLIEDKKLIIKL